MGKVKTHQGTAKRISRTGRGRLRRGRQQAGHLMVKKRPKRRRSLQQPAAVHPADVPKITRLLPHS